MRAGDIVWDAAQTNDWNVASVSDDFFHVLVHFVDAFDDQSIDQ